MNDDEKDAVLDLAETELARLDAKLTEALELLADLVKHWDKRTGDLKWYSGLDNLISVRARALTPEDR
jgi:hypothetical protein